MTPRNRARQISGAALALIAAFGLPACSSPTSSTTLDVSYTSSPDPAPVNASHGVTYKVTNADSTTSTYEYANHTSFTVTIKNEVAIAMDITAIDLTMQQAAGGIVITPSGGDTIYFKFNSSASGNRLSKNGTATVGFDVWYTLPNGGTEGLATVNFGYKDDNNDTYSEAAKVKVGP